MLLLALIRSGNSLRVQRYIIDTQNMHTSLQKLIGEVKSRGPIK